MALTNEHVGPMILAKIKIYVFTRAELLFQVCYETPCSMRRVFVRFFEESSARKKTFRDYLTFRKEGKFKSLEVRLQVHRT